MLENPMTVVCAWCGASVVMPAGCNAFRPFIVDGVAHYFNVQQNRRMRSKALETQAPEPQPMTWSEIEERARRFWHPEEADAIAAEVQAA